MDRALTDSSQPTFWKRRVIGPVLSVLSQGTSPGALSQAVAGGVVCGTFPFLGATTLLAFAAAAVFRLNQPAIHAVNQLLWPAQLALIPAFVYGGAWLRGADLDSFSASAMIAAAKEKPFGEFLAQFGEAGLNALLAWLVAAPLLFGATYFAIHPLFKRLAAKRINKETNS